MKITFIIPREKLDYSDFPIGVLYVATYVKKHFSELNISIFDENISKLKRYLRKENHSIIGIFCTITNLDTIKEYVKIIRQIDKKIKIVFGGPATISSENALKNLDPDIIVIGEGEIPFLKIIKNIQLNKKIDNIPNIIYKNKNIYIKTKIKEQRIELEKEELPDFNLIDTNKYINKWFYFDYYNNIRGISLIISRGCPFNCSFCQPTLKKLFGNNTRYHEPKLIVDKIEELISEFKINSVFFHDDTFTLNKPFTYKFCDELLKRKIKIFWGCNSRVDCIDDKLCKIMYNAGCREVRLGIESFNENTLKYLNKNIEINKINCSLKILKKNKINSFGFIIIGSPHETIQDILKTLIDCSLSKLDFMRISILTNLPGTYLNEKIKTKNMGNEYYNYIKNSKNKCSKLSLNTLNLLKNIGYILFYFHPKRIFNLIKMNNSIKKIKYKLERL